MATSEKGKLGQRTVRSCAVNSLVFSGSRASVASSSSSSDNRKRPCSVGFSGGLLPLSAPSHSPPYLAPSNNVPPCHAPPSYAQSNSRPLSESPRTAVGSVYRTRHLHHHQQRNQQPQNLQARSKSAPSGNGDLAVPVTGDRGTTYCWITDTDIRSNCTKEAAGRFYKHTYGTDRCSSIKVNFPAAGRFVDNHKLNSKRMGYVRWSDTRSVVRNSLLWHNKSRHLYYIIASKYYSISLSHCIIAKLYIAIS